MSDDPIQDTKALAESHGFQFRDCGEGHVQILGNGVLVNYWPLSRRQTAHSPTLNRRETHCTPYNAVKLCMAEGKKDIKPKAKPKKHGPDPETIKPVEQNKAGLRHTYQGDTPPWDESLGEFQFETESDQLRYDAWRLESRAVEWTGAMRLRADVMDEGQQEIGV